MARSGICDDETRRRFDLVDSVWTHLVNCRSIRLAREFSNSAACPKPALISEYSTCEMNRCREERKFGIVTEQLTWISGKRPSRKPLMVPKCSWCLFMRSRVISKGISLALLLPDMESSIEGVGFTEFFILSTRMFGLVVRAEKESSWMMNVSVLCPSFVHLPFLFVFRFEKQPFLFVVFTEKSVEEEEEKTQSEGISAKDWPVLFCFQLFFFVGQSVRFVLDGFIFLLEGDEVLLQTFLFFIQLNRDGRRSTMVMMDEVLRFPTWVSSCFSLS